MWFLINKETGQRAFNLLCNKKYKIGRLQSNDIDICLVDADQSVSRLHADLFIKFEEDQSTEDISHVILTDHSKFGTFVNDAKIDDFQVLRPNDIIRFGVSKSYILKYEPLIVTSSCLDYTDKCETRNLLSRIGGYLVNDWRDDCSFVIMESITITVKVIDALLCQRLIVNKKYLQDLIKLCESKKNAILPDPKDYLPPIGEPQLKSDQISFDPCPKRGILFKDKKFVFLIDDQLNKMHHIIQMASGRCEMFDEKVHLNVKILKKCINEYLFIQIIDPDSSKTLNNQKKLSGLLEGLNQRLIDETEIGLAILKSNLNEHCNPNIKQNNNVKSMKLVPQTCTESCIDNDDFNHIDRSDFVDQSTGNINSSMPLDSMAFQFEKKIEHFAVVSDTQPSTNDLIMVDEEVEVSIDKNTKNKSVCTPMIYNENITTNNSTTILNNPNKSDMSHNKSKIVNISSIKLKDTTNNSQHHVMKQEMSRIEPTSKSSYPNSNVVYSKLRPPPPEAIRPKSEKIKMEEFDTSLTTNAKNNNDQPPSTAPKIKYEPLIIRKKEYSSSSDLYSSNKSSNGKRNFKKFKKIPKITQRFPGKASSNSQFISFKDEPLDINTQFELFMRSKR